MDRGEDLKIHEFRKAWMSLVWSCKYTGISHMHTLIKEKAKAKIYITHFIWTVLNFTKIFGGNLNILVKG